MRKAPLLPLLLALTAPAAYAQCSGNCLRVPGDAATLQAAINQLQGLPGATVELTQQINESVMITGAIRIRSADANLKQLQSSGAGPVVTIDAAGAEVEFHRIELLQVNGVTRNEILRVLAAQRLIYRDGRIRASDGTAALIDASGSAVELEVLDSQLMQTGPASTPMPSGIRNPGGQTTLRRSSLSLRPNTSGGVGIDGGSGRIDFLEASLLNLAPVGALPTQAAVVAGLIADRVRVADSVLDRSGIFPGRAAVARLQLEVHGSRLGATFAQADADFSWLSLEMRPGDIGAVIEVLDSLFFLGGVGVKIVAANPTEDSNLRLRLAGNSFIEQTRHALRLEDDDLQRSPALLEMDLRNNLFYGCQLQYVVACSPDQATIVQGWVGVPQQLVGNRNLYVLDASAPIVLPASAFQNGQFPEPLASELIRATPGWPMWQAPNNAADFTPRLDSPLLNSGAPDSALRPDGPRLDPLGRRRPAGRWDVGSHENPDPLLADGFESP